MTNTPQPVSLDSPDTSTAVDMAGDIAYEADVSLLQSPGANRAERRPRHFKGKGRAWKKEESDEDGDFTATKKKSPKPKPQNPAETQKKRAKPRKSKLSEDFIRDDSESGEEGAGAESHTAPLASTDAAQIPAAKWTTDSMSIIQDMPHQADGVNGSKIKQATNKPENSDTQVTDKAASPMVHEASSRQDSKPSPPLAKSLESNVTEEKPITTAPLDTITKD